MVEFTVVGGLQDQPGHLLLRGEDPWLYLYDPEHHRVTRFQPEAGCAVTIIKDSSLVFVAPKEIVRRMVPQTHPKQ